MDATTTTTNGVTTDFLHGGAGEPTFYLHSVIGETMWLPFCEELSAHVELFLPTHPGYGTSEGFSGLSSVEDLVYHYLDLFDELDLAAVNLVGCSLGGWIAVELAARNPERVKTLVLVNALGLWLDDDPIGELFGLESDDLAALLCFRADSDLSDYLSVSPGLQALHQTAPVLPLYKNLAAAARYGWDPYMHNPKLPGLLHRVKSPTQVIWAAHDRVVSPNYGKRYADYIHGAALQIVPNAGHILAADQPRALSNAVLGFMRSVRSS
jgi:pimeloyl-ACP methyl ester carboxylesterase